MYVVNMGSGCSPRAGYVLDYLKENNGPKQGHAIHMDKTTTKVHIMFNCFAKKDGFSLNDAICAGHKSQKDLFDVLIRLRRRPVAVACDIKELYLQVIEVPIFSHIVERP